MSATSAIINVGAYWIIAGKARDISERQRRLRGICNSVSLFFGRVAVSDSTATGPCRLRVFDISTMYIHIYRISNRKTVMLA